MANVFDQFAPEQVPPKANPFDQFVETQSTPEANPPEANPPEANPPEANPFDRFTGPQEPETAEPDGASTTGGLLAGVGGLITDTAKFAGDVTQTAGELALGGLEYATLPIRGLAGLPGLFKDYVDHLHEIRDEPGRSMANLGDKYGASTVREEAFARAAKEYADMIKSTSPTEGLKGSAGVLGAYLGDLSARTSQKVALHHKMLAEGRTGDEIRKELHKDSFDKAGKILDVYEKTLAGEVDPERIQTEAGKKVREGVNKAFEFVLKEWYSGLIEENIPKEHYMARAVAASMGELVSLAGLGFIGAKGHKVIDKTMATKRRNKLSQRVADTMADIEDLGSRKKDLTPEEYRQKLDELNTKAIKTKRELIKESLEADIPTASELEKSGTTLESLKQTEGVGVQVGVQALEKRFQAEEVKQTIKQETSAFSKEGRQLRKSAKEGIKEAQAEGQIVRKAIDETPIAQPQGFRILDKPEEPKVGDNVRVEKQGEILNYEVEKVDYAESSVEPTLTMRSPDGEVLSVTGDVTTPATRPMATKAPMEVPVRQTIEESLPTGDIDITEVMDIGKKEGLTKEESSQLYESVVSAATDISQGGKSPVTDIHYFGSGLASKQAIGDAVKATKKVVNNALDYLQIWHKDPATKLSEQSKEAVRKRLVATELAKVKVYKESQYIKDKFTAQDNLDMPYYLEKTGNPLFSKTDTFETLSKRMSGEARNYANRRLRPYLDEIFEDGVKHGVFVEEQRLSDFAPHVYDLKAETVKGNFRIQAAIKRKYKNYEEAYKAEGLRPAPGGMAAILQQYGNVTYRAAFNKKLIDELKSLRMKDPTTGEELRVMMPRKEAEGNIPLNKHMNKWIPESEGNWVVVDHKALNQTAWFRTDEGALQGLVEPVAIHPDVAYALKMVFENKHDGALTRLGETVNAVAKTSEIAFSLFHYVALAESGLASGGLTRGKSYRPIVAAKEGLKLLEKDGTLKDALEAGLNIGRTARNDLYADRMQQILNLAEERGKLGIQYGAKGVKWYKELNEKALWDFLHRGQKLYWYETLLKEGRLKNVDKKMTDLELRRSIAEFVNDAFGGLNWETMFSTNPKMAQIYRMVLLAPDWTFAQLRVAGKGARAAGKMVVGEKLTYRDRLYMNYMRNATLAYLVVHNAFNAIFTALMYGEPRTIFENDPDHRSEIELPNNVFTEPMAHARQAMLDSDSEMMKSIAQNKFVALLMGAPDKRKRYIHFGKQIREVVRWIDNPWGSLGSKASPIARQIIAQLSLHEAGEGYPTKFADKSLTNREAGAYRVVHFLSMFAPFSFSSNQFAFSMPMRKGTSKYKAVKDVTAELESLDQYIVGRMYDVAMDPTRLEGSAEERVMRLLNAAEENGHDPYQIFSIAKGQSNTEILKEFWQGYQEGDFDQMNEAADRLNKRGLLTKQSFKQSMRNKAHSETRDPYEERAMLLGALKAFRGSGGKYAGKKKMDKRFGISRKGAVNPRDEQGLDRWRTLQTPPSR